MSAEANQNAVSIPKTAKEFGMDSFSVYGLIQRDQLHPRRERSGELMILQIEIDEALKRTESKIEKH
ncbi:MAG TPA: hypothetical protein VFV23_07595 [Verrucomicrobiae bacterium]|nr:hypothetical protein [Verrucomicrobiae bacterium]